VARLALISAVALLACGRSPLFSPMVTPGSPPDAGGKPDAGTMKPDAGCASAASCDDAVACTEDHCLPDGACEHVPTDAACDDGDFCKISRCDEKLGCQSEARDCNDGVACHQNRCDSVTASCIHERHNLECPTGQVCGAQGCVSCTSDAECDDGLACTDDRCDASGVCSHMPDDSACAEGQSCGITGCGAWAYAESYDTLYQVEVRTGAVWQIGMTEFNEFDIALSPEGVLYGFDGQFLDQLDRGNASTSQFAAFTVDMNGINFGPDGTLYGAGEASIYVFHLDTGTFTTLGTLPDGYLSAGDIVMYGSQLFISATGAGAATSSLVAADPFTGTTHVVGDIGFNCVLGLAALGSDLLGFTCDGEVISIDSFTGKGALRFHTGLKFQGATSR
jgi:hypothetical protein